MKNLLIFLLVFSFGQISVSFGKGKPDLSHLDYETQMIIKTSCSPHQLSGPVPYWNCLRKQLRSIGR